MDPRSDSPGLVEPLVDQVARADDLSHYADHEVTRAHQPVMPGASVAKEENLVPHTLACPV